MSRPRYTKADINQIKIVEELRALGYDVDIICNLPGLYDLVVSGERSAHIHGREMLHHIPASVRVEVKSADGLLSDQEFEYYKSLNHKDTYIVAYNVKDVLNWFNGIVPE